MQSTGTKFLGASVGQGGTSEVTRDIITNDPVLTGEEITVNLNVVVGSSSDCIESQADICNDYYVIEEQVPDGAHIISVSPSFCEIITGPPPRIICIKLQDAVAETITYHATMPANPQTVLFSGIYEFQGDSTLNQIAGDSSVIVQQEIPSSCTPNWVCSNWGNWTDSRSCGARTRICTDQNQCYTTDGKPNEIETSTCPTTNVSVCTSSWVCTEWSECIDGTSTRTCRDSNHCTLSANKPDEIFNGCKAGDIIIQPPPQKDHTWLYLLLGGGAIIMLILANGKGRRKK